MNSLICERMKECPVFFGCDDSVIEQTAENYSTLIKAKKGEILISKDNFTPGLHIIISGRAAVYKSNTSDVFMSVIEEGGVFGMASMFRDSDDGFPTSIIALTDCEMAVIPQSELTGLFEKHPDIALNYIKLLTKKIRFLNLKIDTYTSPSAVVKLAFYLLTNSDSSNRVLIPRQGMTALAKQLNTGRASLYRAFDCLEGQNLIKRDGKIIFVLDKNKLKNIQE